MYVKYDTNIFYMGTIGTKKHEVLFIICLKNKYTSILKMMSFFE